MDDIIVKLLMVKDAADGRVSTFSSQGQAMSGYEELANYRALIEKLRPSLSRIQADLIGAKALHDDYDEDE